MSLPTTDRTKLNNLSPNLVPQQIAVSALRLAVFQEIYTVLDNIITDLNAAQATGAVTTPKLADSSVSTLKLADNAVTGAKLLDAAVIASKLADGSVTTTKMGDGAVVTIKLADGAVVTAKIADLNVTSGKIADNAVISVKLADGAVLSAKIADGAVTSLKIADGGVTGAKIADNTITTQKLVDSIITAAKILDGSVTNAKLAPGSVTGDKVANGAINSQHLDGTLLAQAGQIATQAKFDEISKNLKNYDIFTNGLLDGVKVTNILATSAEDTFYLPPGDYVLTSPIVITTDVSLTMDDNAKLTATTILECFIKYNNSTPPTKRRRITGGTLDGADKVQKGIIVVICTDLLIDNMQINNIANIGIDYQSGYGLNVRNIVMRNYSTLNIANNIGISISTSDAYFSDITITEFTTGIRGGDGNMFNRVHIWNTSAARIPSSIGIDNSGGSNMYNNVYLDTCNIGIKSSIGCKIYNSIFYTFPDYMQYLFNPVYIQNDSAGDSYIYFRGCIFDFFDKNSTGKTISVCSNLNQTFFDDCSFPASSAFTNRPNNPSKVYVTKRVLSTTGWPSIPAGGSWAKDISTTAIFTDPRLKYSDSVMITPSGNFESGLIPVFTPLDDTVRVTLYNVSSAPITPVDRSIFVTLVKDRYKNTLPWT